MTAKKKPTRKAAKKQAKPAPEAKPAKELTLAQKARRLEIRNIFTKLNEGKTLNARENRLLETHLEDESADLGGKTQRMRDMVESMSAAASRIGCTIEEVKLAKALGCSAFGPSNRITVSELTAFISTDEFKAALTQNLEDTTAADWDKRLKRAKALQAEHRLNVEKGKAWDAEQVRMLIGAGDVAMSETLRRWLESEQPPIVEGKSAAEILKANRKFLDDLLADLTASRVSAMERLGENLADDEDDEE